MREKDLGILAVFCISLLLIGGVGTTLVAMGDDPGLRNYEHEPMPEALEAMESDENVTVTEEGGDLDMIGFDPVDEDPVVGMAFAAGMDVDPRAYAPPARAIAEEGYFVVLFYADQMEPSADPFYEVIPNYPEIEEWSVGGHSHGGVCAGEYMDEEEPEGLNLWASYPNPGIYGIGETDLSDKEGEFASIYGTEDGRTTVEDIEDSKERLPDDTEFVEIDGGNHAQFGYYGEQDGDGEAEITREEQQEIIIEASLTHLDAIRGVQEYDLTIDAEEGGTTDPDPGVHTYEEGEEVTMTAIPDEGWKFEEWTGDQTGTEAEIDITMDGDKEITAWFEEDKEMYDLIVHVEGEGSVEIDPDRDEYEEGTEVTLTAVPEEGWYFEEWTGDHTGTEEEMDIVMDNDEEITAWFEEEVETFSLTIIVEGEGDTDPEEGTHTFSEDEEVTITAVAEEGWYFKEWTGSHEGVEEEIKITMNEDKEVTAWFEEEGVETHELTINIEGEGTVEVNGHEFEDGHTEEYPEDTELDLVAVPAEGWFFEEWTGDHTGTEEEITVPMDENKEVIGNFEEGSVNHELTIEVEGGGSTDPEEGTHTYLEGEEVTVTATADEGWYFEIWSGASESSEREITVVLDSEKTLTAHFNEVDEDEYVLSIDVEGEGTTEPDPGEHTFGEGSEVTVTAIAEEGWFFVEWTGDHESTEEEITLIMDSDKDITVHFKEHTVGTYDLTINIDGEGSTDPEEGNHTLEEGSEVTVTATAEEGWFFVEWTGDHESTEEEITITMDSDQEMTAHFEEEKANFEVEIIGYEENVTEGEDVTIRFRVTNTGGVEESRFITLYSDGEQLEVYGEVELGPGEEYEGEFILELEEVGEHEFAVDSNDSQESININVMGDDTEDDDGTFVSEYWWLIGVLLIGMIAVALMIFVMQGEEDENGR